MSQFQSLLNQSGNGNFIFETKNKFFDIEIEVIYSQQEIHVRYYKGRMLEPVKREIFHSLHGMFGNSDCETKFMDILKSFKH